MPGKPLVIEAIAVEAIGRAQAVEDAQPEFAPRPGPLAPLAATRIYTEGAFHDTQVFDRDAMRPGDAVTGPAVIREDNATTVVEPGWRALFTARGDLVLERHEAARRTHAIGTTADPVLLEVFNNLFMAIAEQMGVTLANTAYSVNIKERLDFSCAIFDAAGQPDRQRAAHAGAPGLDGRERQDDHRPPPRGDASPATCSCSTRRTTAARTCPT